ncbi:Transposable element P transposase, partial [Pseudolycoriella hygida]
GVTVADESTIEELESSTSTIEPDVEKNGPVWYPSIMNPIENDKKDTIHNLRVPFEHGWTRELVYSSNNMKNAEVYYVCPAGNRMRTKREVFQNLGNLNIWNFSFAKRPLGCNGEIIRTASARGCRDLETAFKMQKASVDVGNSSAQQSICSLITEATDNSMNIRSPGEKWWRFMFVLYVSNCFHDLRINEEIDFLCCFFCKECLYNGTELNQYRIRQLLESNTEISPLYKLSLHHLEVKGAERQCVRLASELFSHTVAESVRRNFPKDAVAHKLADFIELVNNWFDIMNSYTPNGIAYKAPYGKDLEEQNRVLDEMYWTIKTMKCFNKKGELQESLQISQKGILMSITSIKGLRKEMEEKFKFRFILTHRTNQDFEENFFSQIRGRNGPIDHPSPVECLYTIKAIILGKNPGIGRHLHSNTIEQDPEEYVSATFMRHLSRDENIDGICERNGDQHEIGNIELLENDSDDDIREKIANDMTEDFLADYTNDIKVLPNDSNGLETCIRLEIEIIDEAQTEFLDDLDPEMAIDETAARKARSTEDGLEYLAGWIAWKFKKKHPEFSKTRRETLSSHITDHTYAKRIGIESSSWIDRVSYGGLTKPSNEVMQWVRRMENVFIEIHGDEFNNRMNIRKLLISELEAECKEVPSLVINLYARSRIYMRCKFLNKQREEKALLLRVLKRPHCYNKCNQKDYLTFTVTRTNQSHMVFLLRSQER